MYDSRAAGYNFTDQVRKALATAREEAIALRHDYVGTEHILLGVLRDETAVTLLQNLGVAPEPVRARILESVRRGKATVALGELPYTSRAKKVLEFTMVQAREMDHSYVGTEHLLLGLLSEEKGIAAEVLNQLGVTLERARSFLGVPLEPEAGGQFHVRIDDASDRSIYEQIIAQITEAVATGVLRPGERLPTVRQLADALDIAPGTVARAYGELEQQGVVVTEGARGTRVAERTPPADAEFKRPETLAGLLRPVAVAAFHLGASADELRTALEKAMRGIFDKPDRPS